MGPLGASWERLGGVLGRLGGVLDAAWPRLVMFWGRFSYGLSGFLAPIRGLEVSWAPKKWLKPMEKS